MRKKLTMLLTLVLCAFTSSVVAQTYYKPGARTTTLEAGKQYFVSVATWYGGACTNLLYSNNGTLATSSHLPDYTTDDVTYLFTVEEVGANNVFYIKNSQGKYLQSGNLASTDTKTGITVVPYNSVKGTVTCGNDVDACDEHGAKIAYSDITDATPIVCVYESNDKGWRYINGLGTGKSTAFAFYEVIEQGAAKALADAKDAAKATLTTWATLSVLAEKCNAAVATVEAITLTDAGLDAALAEIDAIMNASVPYLIFRNGDPSHANRVNAYLASRANREKAHGTQSASNWSNIVWSWKYAGSGAFYFYNEVHKLYMGKPSSNGALTASPEAAYTFELIDAATNKVEFKCEGQTLHLNNHSDGLLSNYDSDDVASRWYVETDLSARLTEYKNVNSTVIAEATALAADNRLASSQELANLNAAIAKANSDDLVTVAQGVIELPTLIEAANHYIRESNKAYITALNYTENSNHPVVVNNKRSNWAVAQNPTGLNTLAELVLAQSEADTKQQFAFITPDGGQNYYLYSVHAQRYLKSDNTFAAQGEPVAFADASSQGANRVQVRFKDYNNKYFNVGGSNQMAIDWWSTIDDGNACEIVQYNTLEFDLDYALRVFNEGADLTIKYMYGGELKHTEKVFKWKNEEYTITLPWGYTSIESCTVAGEAISATGTAWKFTVAGSAEVVVNLAFNTPFTVSQNFESAAWHVMRIRPVRNGNEEFNWVSKTDATPYTFSSERPTTDAGLWAFVGNPIDGFKIYNKAAGQESTLGVNGSNVVVKSGEKTWTVGKCVENGTTRGFYLYEGTGNNYVHDMEHSLKIWNSTSAPTDGGSALVAYHPLTIKYMFDGAEVENLRVDTYVTPGSVYNITNSEAIVNDSKMIESCQVGDAYIDAVNGVFPVTVNGVMTVTVTLKSSVSNLRPYYALKSATGTYLGMTPKADGLVADGVYTITGDANGSRGYLAAGVQYTTRPILSDITYSGCTGNSVDAIDNGKNWYVYTTAVGTYIYNIGKGQFLAQEWNCIVFSDVPYAWNIKQNGTYTSIYDNAMAKYLSMGCGTSPSIEWEQGDPIVRWDTNANDGGAQHTFTAVTEGDYTAQIAAAQAAIAKVSVSFQNTPLYLYYTPTADGATFEYKDEPGKYLGFEEWGWNVVNAQSAWTIQDADYEGYSYIVRAADAEKHLGSSENTNVGTGIFSNVGSSCNKWALEGVYANYATTATERNGKYYFTSERLSYVGVCNILRFTLTDSGAKYKNGKNRMSFDSFVLYDINGKPVELTEDCFDGNYNKSYAGLLDGLNAGEEGAGCCCGTWDSSDEGNDYFEITLPDGVDLGGAFSFSFVTENTTMNAKAFDIAMSYKSNSYKLNIVAPYGTVVNATYNGEPIAHGGIISGGFDQTLLEIADIENFAYTVTVDGRVVTIEFVQTGAIVNPASVVALINRIGGTNTANSFKFVLDPSLNLDQETFVIGGEDGKILIKGTTISAITTGLGWYLNNIAHINIAWNSLNEKTVAVKWDANAAYADLSYLPVPTTEETHSSDAKYRYYLNYCTFGYSMTSWTWTRWQQEIDWMALHGINMPLQIVGLEEVWRKFLTMEDANGNRKYNYSDSEAKAFVAGPAFTAWWGMNNLEGWGGTSADGWGGVQDDAWYDRQQALATQILTLQRELGMQPVLPGFSGMVPSNFKDKTGVECNAGTWGGFTRPKIVLPSNARFAEIAADYYACLKEVMGESQYYSMDPFHEGDEANATKEAYTAIYDAMETAKSGSQWVIQQWQWYGGNQTYSLQGVPAGKLIVLDLFSDGRPEFDKHGYNGYDPQDAVFCAIPNFGGRSGLMGRLQNVTDNYFKYKSQYTTIKGIGTAPEAIEQTPITYDLIYQLPWMNGVKPDVAAWVDNYAVARYGKDNTVVKEAWSLLRQGPLNYGADAIQGPVEDVWAARPNLDANPASSWGTTLNGAGNTYTPARRQMLIDAVYKLIDQEDELELTNSVYRSNYLYDLVEFGGAVMADYAYDLLLGIRAAKNAEGTSGATYMARRDAFLQLILDMDAFRGTNLNFRLGKWTQEARDAAAEVTGATTATPDWYEFNNARTILTTWGDQSQNGGLKDYSYRSWQGLLADYYYPRWKYYFDNNCNGPSSGYFFFEWNWAHGMEHSVGQTSKSTTRLAEGAKGYSYSRNPEGNTVEEAVKMLGKYIIPVAMADGTHYAYRYLTNDLSSKVTIIAVGESIDLTQYFGALEGATVTGDFINGGSSTNFAEIPLKANLDGAYTGTITLADGTVLTFGVSANPKYYGVYRIYYKNGNSDAPVFVAYNTDDGSGTGAGYKLIAEGTYTTTDEVDKLFTIAPSGTGYSISAQGKYLQSPNLSAWKHILFSDDKSEAGAYIFEEEQNLSNVFKMRSTGSGINYVNDWDNLVFGNDKSDKEDLSTFTFSEKITTYAITIPEGGLYTVCLPFNVVLPTGVTAYDVTVAGLTSGDDGAITTLATIATEGQILKAGTPAVLKAAPATYNFIITMDNTDAKTSSPESKLRGNFVKQTLQPGTGGLSKFMLDAATGKFELLSAEQEIPANTCWIEAKIDAVHVEVTEHEGKVVKVDDWLFEYDDATNGIKLKNVVTPGDGNLEIKETFTVNGKTQKVVAITPDFMWGRDDVTEITLPSSLVNLGFRKVNHLFNEEYAGRAGNGVVDDTEENPVTGNIEKQGMHDCLIFPDNNTEGASDEEKGKPFKIGKDYAWKLTLDVTVDTTGNKLPSFNEWGSSIVSTKPNSLDDYYQGYMQIYLRKDLEKIVVKIDNADDRYTYSTPALDKEGNELKKADGSGDSLHVNANFKFELEHDGTGGYQVVIYYSNGKAKMYNITASENNKVKDFDRLYFSLPEGISVKVSFERLTNEGLFVGCTNLERINVHPDNPTFSSCEHGVLYDKNKYYVMRIPEGRGTQKYDIPSKVVKLYPGAIHGVKADVVLHSNPQIGVVDGHEEDVKEVKFYLSLDDIDNTITANEKGYGGARDFTSTNANTYVAANYKRAPLAKGVYGTIMLPFAISDDALNKYDFFKFIGGDATSLSFSQVTTLEAQTPYLYKLKETPGVMKTETVVEEDGKEKVLDVFESTDGFTVQTLAKYDPADEKPGSSRALGAFVNHYIETNLDATKKSAYYYYSISKEKFLKVTKKLTYRPYRVLFVVTPETQEQVASAPARLSLRLVDGSTTEIDASQVEGMEETIYYDLQGRRVLNPTNGVYIVNGKKVVIE